MTAVALYTVGHSNRQLEALLVLLAEHGIDHLVDVRRYPSSRRFPHFNRRPLEDKLREASIGYSHVPELGGHRSPMPSSPHTALSPGLMGYADHMGTTEFQQAAAHLLREAVHLRLAVMCAERDPERCHRQLLADAAVVAGAHVWHILDGAHTVEHRLHPAAEVAPDGVLSYPARGQLDLF